jgi:KaiC/GvpD/RAD55 family RecA-like ATPase
MEKKNELERLKTGIPGLDEIIGGGIPNNHLLLVTGTAGAGKTIFCSQYIYQGITKYKDNAIYLSFEEPVDSIKTNLKTFGWDFDKLEKQGTLSFIRYDPYHIEDVFDMLESTIREIKATRVVVDSISALGLHIRDQGELRSMIFNLSNILRKLNCTSVLSSEIVPGSSGISRYGVEEFVTDGVIVMYYERIASTFSRAVQVWKMRGSSHSEKLHPYKIDPEGIRIYPEEEAFVHRRQII